MEPKPQVKSSFKGRALGAFRDARQAALEKVGKKENTVEPESLRKQTALLEQHNNLLQRHAKSIAKQSKQYGALADDGMAVADSLADVSTSTQPNEIAEDYTQLAEKLAEFHAGMEDLRLQLNVQTGDVAEALRALTKAEIRHAKQTKGKYDRVRLTYEAQLAKVTQLRNKNKADKAMEAQKECDDMKESFEAAGRDTLETIENANLVCEYETVNQLANYLEAHQHYFAKCHAWLTQTAPMLENARAFVEKQRAVVLEREKSAALLAQKGQVFGEKLDVLLEKEGGDADVPRVVTEMVAYLTDNALGEEGIFRVTGFKSEVAALRKRAETEEDFSLDNAPNLAHEVASLLKAFLREMPEPLCTYALYDQFVTCADLPVAERLPAVRQLVAQLPTSHAALLRTLLRLLKSVVERADENKMSSSNLSIVISPNVFVAAHADPARLVKESASASKLFEWMISCDQDLFAE